MERLIARAMILGLATTTLLGLVALATGVVGGA